MVIGPFWGGLDAAPFFFILQEFDKTCKGGTLPLDAWGPAGFVHIPQSGGRLWKNREKPGQIRRF
ncbi:MAG: hypothetical protein ACLTV2_10725 [Acutalibacter sp.]